MKKAMWTLAALGIGLLVASSVALAKRGDGPKNPRAMCVWEGAKDLRACRDDARQDRRDCVLDCQEVHQPLIHEVCGTDGLNLEDPECAAAVQALRDCVREVCQPAYRDYVHDCASTYRDWLSIECGITPPPPTN